MTEQEQMLISLLNCRRVDLYTGARGGDNLTDNEKEEFSRMQARRVAGEPLQYILGRCEFMGVELFVDRRVLVPRPETEHLVEQGIHKLRDVFGDGRLEILDLGTGSGNIAVALAKELKDCHITSVDISQDALDVACVNALRNNVMEKVSFIHRDMQGFLKESARENRKFHAIISNPPYIPSAQLAQLPKDVRQEPPVALDGGKDGLKYLRQIFTLGPGVLNPGGLIFCEIGDGERPGIEEMLKNLKLNDFAFIKDYNKIDRVIRIGSMVNGR